MTFMSVWKNLIGGQYTNIGLIGLLKESGRNSVFENNNGHYSLTMRSMRKQMKSRSTLCVKIMDFIDE